MDWFFAKATEREGFTASPITYFSGKRLASTVRECIQNSLDAAVDDAVHVGFTLKNHHLDDLPSLRKLVPYLQSALDEERNNLKGRATDSEIENSEAVSFYREALKELEDENVNILGIHDWGTSGLTGHIQEAEGVPPSPWLALIRGQGVDVKKSQDALGSFGQGSKAPFALSRLRTIFYLSRSTEPSGQVDRYIGKAILSSAWHKDGGSNGSKYLTKATGYFAADDDASPITGDGIPRWAFDARSSLTKGSGVSLFIPAPLEDAQTGDFDYQLLAAILLNFYYAIESGRLIITLPSGKELNNSNVREIAQGSGLLTDRNLNSDEIVTLQTLVWARDKWRGVRESESFGAYFFAIRTTDSLTEKRVGIARKTGMLITKRPKKLERFSGVKNFDLFICVTGQKGSSILRDLENPSHDAFEFDRVANPAKRKSHTKAYEIFEAEVRALIDEFASLDSVSDFFVDDLNDLLGASGSSEESSKENRIEFPKTYKIISKTKRSKHLSIFTGTQPDGSFGSGGSGRKSKRKGGSNSGDVAGDNEGNLGGKLKVATDLILFRSPKTGAFTLIFSIDKKAGAESLRIFKSGDSSIQPLRISLESGGPLIGSIPREKWQAVGSGARRFKVTFATNENLESLEAFTDHVD
jgi:hypothetical protein